MKKIVSIITVAIIISLSLCGIASADSLSIEIESTFTKNVEATAKQWYGTEKNRALITCLLAADVFMSMGSFDSDDLTNFILNPTYVGISTNSRQIMVAGYYDTIGGTTILVIIYTPSTKELAYMPISLSGTKMSSSTIETILITAVQDSAEYKKNDKKVVLEQLNSLLE